MGDYNDQRIERVDVHRADVGNLSQSFAGVDVYRNFGCGQEKDRNGTGRAGFGHSCYGDARDGDGACGIDAQSDGYIQPFVPECAAAESAVETGAAEYIFHYASRPVTESAVHPVQPDVRDDGREQQWNLHGTLDTADRHNAGGRSFSDHSVCGGVVGNGPQSLFLCDDNAGERDHECDHV